MSQNRGQQCSSFVFTRLLMILYVYMMSVSSYAVMYSRLA